MTRKPTILEDFTNADHVSHSHGQPVVWDEDTGRTYDRNCPHRRRQSVADWQDMVHRRPRRGRLFLTAVKAAGMYAALCLLALYVLSKAGF